MGTQILVTGPSGQVQTGPPRLVDDTVTQDVQGGAPAGPYTVAWRVTSADGHPVSGTFSFTSSRAGAGTAQTAPTASAAPAAGTAADGSLRQGLPGIVAAVVVVIAVAGVGLRTVLLRRRSARSER